MQRKKCYFIVILLLINISFTANLVLGQNDQSIVRLTELKPAGIDFLIREGYQLQFDELTDQALLALSPEEITMLDQMGYTVEIVRQQSRASIDAAYHNYYEIWEYLDSIVQAHSDIVILDTLGYSQLEGLPLPMLKISDNPASEEDEVAVLFDGMHHAREPIGFEICMKLINHLVNGYGSDPEVDFWINETEIFILPLINPEGWKYITDENLTYPFWRKNKRDNDMSGNFSPENDGVDLNRNYASAWENGDPAISSEVYRGPEPFSESELQAKKNLVLEQKPVMGITYHSFGEVVIYANSLGGMFFPDHQHIAQIGAGIASRIARVNGGIYNSGYFGLEAGLSNFWMYAETGCFEYCIETGTDFIPSYNLADAVSDDNLPGALYLLDCVRGPGITGHITDSVSGEPLVATYKILELYNPVISPRTSDSLYGRYFRPLLPGLYTIEFSKEGYYSRTLENIEVTDGNYIELDIKLVPTDVVTAELSIDEDQRLLIFPNPVHDQLYIQSTDILGQSLAEVIDLEGVIRMKKEIEINTPGLSLTMDVADLKPGIYFLRITSVQGIKTIRFIKL